MPVGAVVRIDGTACTRQFSLALIGWTSIEMSANAYTITDNYVYGFARHEADVPVAERIEID